jgi:hypothetical protein
MTGDGAPEYVVRTQVDRLNGKLGGSDTQWGGSEVCDNEIFQATPSGSFIEAYNFQCCDYAPLAGHNGQGGAIQCRAPNKWTIRYQGQWPKFEKSRTRTQIKAALDKGMALFHQGDFRGAAAELCQKTEMAGDDVPEYLYACATAALRGGDTSQAYAAADRGAAAFPKFAGFHLSLAKIAEGKGDKGTAIAEYEKFLQLGTTPNVQKEVETKIRELKQK